MTFINHDLNVSLLFWIMELLLLLILLLAAIEHRGHLITPKWWSLVLAAVVLATSALAASRNAIFPPTAWGHLAITTTHFALACAVFSLFAGVWQRERRTLLLVVMLSALTQVLTTFVLIGFAFQIADFNWLYFHGAVGNVRQLGFVGITLVALAAGLLVTTFQKRSTSIYWLALVPGLSFINLIGGRASFLASFAALMFSVYLAKTDSRLLLAMKASGAWIVSAIVSLIFIPPHNEWGLPRIFGTSNRLVSGGDFSSGRWSTWIQTTEKFFEHPLIGHGESQFAKVLDFSGMILNHPHNFVLQFLFQWGLIGSIAIFGLAGSILFQAWKYRAAACSVFVPAFALILAMTVMASLEGNFYHVYPLVNSAFGFALLATIGNRRGSQPL